MAVELRHKPDSAGRVPALSPPDLVLTDEQGRFRFTGDRLVEGRYELEIGRIGYESIVDSLVFRSNLGLRIEAALVPSAVELDPILVVAEARSQNLEARGFYVRRTRGVGSFLTREQVEQRKRVTDVGPLSPNARCEC